jgi:hypothetical protein
MRITFRVPADVYDANSGGEIDSSAVSGTRSLDGTIADYLDRKLADLGIVGGTLRLVYEPLRGLEFFVDYWAPAELTSEHLSELQDETRGQFSDGIGEGGFEVELPGTRVRVVANTDEPFEAEQVDDGRVDEDSARLTRSLLEHGADARRISDSGQTVHEYAANRNKAAMLRTLEAK